MSVCGLFCFVCLNLVGTFRLHVFNSSVGLRMLQGMLRGTLLLQASSLTDYTSILSFVHVRMYFEPSVLFTLCCISLLRDCSN